MSPEQIEVLQSTDNVEVPTVNSHSHTTLQLDNKTVIVIAVVMIVVAFGVWAFLDYNRYKNAASSSKSASNESTG